MIILYYLKRKYGEEYLYRLSQKKRIIVGFIDGFIVGFAIILCLKLVLMVVNGG